MDDEKFMRRAIALAKYGIGAVDPNPLVGAVIVKDGKIIGEGYHERIGGLHAERNAFRSLKENGEGAVMYVTLEPCCHYGKTPPCTEAIIENKISKVIIGSKDPNPKICGKGVAVLRKAGIEVVEDFLKKECDALNERFFHYISTGTPYVTMKYAMTADGKIATKTGASKWISGETSRALVQEMRNEYPAIMAGIGTVMADDPKLTCRLEGGRDPIRIICDSDARIPLGSFIVQTAKEINTYVAVAVPGIKHGIVTPGDFADNGKDSHGQEDDNVSPAYDKEGIAADFVRYMMTPGISEPHKKSGIEEKKYTDVVKEKLHRIEELLGTGVHVINVPDDNKENEGLKTRVDLKALMKCLGELEISGVLLEGGARLNYSALQAGIVQEINVFLAPKVFGGQAKSPVEGLGVELPEDSYKLELQGSRFIDGDVLLKYKVRKKCLQE